jgi:hypothetical protein
LKAYWDPKTVKNKQAVKQIENAKAGMKKLSEAGIDIQAMEEKDWIFLRDKFCPSAGICTVANPYKESEREKLDNFIRNFILEDIMVSSTLSIANRN